MIQEGYSSEKNNTPISDDARYILKRSGAAWNSLI